jgi:chromosomal replication initiation ATPase DnaA
MTQQLRLNLGRNISFTRETFVGGQANRQAWAAVQSYPCWHGGCLAVYGGPGVGKTHLAQIWAQEHDAMLVHRDDLARGLDGGRPILVEDLDRGFRDPEALFHLINAAAQSGGGLLITARTPPIAWPSNLPDLRSRLNAMPVVQINEPDDDVLGGILEKLLKEHSILPPGDLIPYLLRRMERSASAAREVVERLDALADQLQRSISRQLARQILEDDMENLDLFAG